MDRLNISDEPWILSGQGLAGTCLAWLLWWRGARFQIVDRAFGGSSRVAAGMINPITGKNFEPSWRINEFLPEALEFYAQVESQLGIKIWYPFPVLRLAATEKEWGKIQSKQCNPMISPWIIGAQQGPAGWMGAMLLQGGGRVDTKAFIDCSRDFFMEKGCYQVGEIPGEDTSPQIIRCEGAMGLLQDPALKHRCAKGEILTIKAVDWDPTQIRVGGGGWCIPQGGNVFKVGSTYEWDTLDNTPTEQGRMRVEELAQGLGGGEAYEILAHEAGVRPILRRSEPLIGPMPSGGWIFNGLGSKGSLYAPGVAARLSRWLMNQQEPEADLDIRAFLK